MTERTSAGRAARGTRICAKRLLIWIDIHILHYRWEWLSEYCFVWAMDEVMAEIRQEKR